jgi:AcrR family transcriptional regulator
MKMKTAPTLPDGVLSAREKLLQTAVALFAARGYAGTAVREIVARAGVSKPVLYYYFKSKEGLFQAIIDYAAEVQSRLLSEALKDPGPVQERMILLFRRIREGVRRHYSLYIMIHNLLFGPPQGAPPCDLMRFHRDLAAAIRRMCTEAAAAGEMSRARIGDATYLVLSIIDFSLSMEQLLDQEPWDPNRTERMLRLAFTGVQGDGE